MKSLFSFPQLTYWRRLFCLVILTYLPQILPAQNQDFKLPELDQKPFTYTVPLQDVKEIEGTKEGYMQGETEVQPLQFAVKGLGYALYPVTVTILCNDPEEDVSITFVKEHWGDTISMTETHNGNFQDHFKVGMEFGFKIHSSRPGVKFSIAVWVGKEMKLKRSQLFYPASEYKATPKERSVVNKVTSSQDDPDPTKQESNAVLIIISIALAGIFILLGVLVFLKAKKRTLMIIWLLVIPGFLKAGAGSSSFQNFKDVFELYKKVSELSGKVSSLEAAAEAWREYSGADQQFEPETDPRGMPRLPSSCLSRWTGPASDEDAESEGREHEDHCQCLEDAYDKLNELRYKFEKLKIIYKSTKDMTDKAVAFGDGLAPSTGIASIAWQNERVKIMDSMKGLESAYDNKHGEFVDDLYENLTQISACEEGLGFEQWYDKVGFIYFEFMSAHYERQD